MPAGAAVTMGVDAGAVTLGLSGWTGTFATRADLIGTTSMPTASAVAWIAAQVRAGAFTASTATTLRIDVTADAVGLARSGKGSADTTQPQEAANSGGNRFEGLAT